MRFTVIILLLLLSTTILPGQERYYYTGKNYGSEAVYNPLYLVLNGSYDIIQLEGHTREFLTFPYGAGFRNVAKNIGSPFAAISHYGLGSFLRHEVFPVSFNVGEAQWWPNYQLHLIGGGMTYVAMREWYDAHGFAGASIWSIGTMAAYHMLNEVVENGEYQGWNVDPIADLYIFDIGGIILFSSDAVKRFFSQRLNMADWSLQPGITFPRGTLQNNGQYFSVKWKLPFSESLHLFYYFGLRGLLGVSHKQDDGAAFSAGIGMRAVRLKTIDEVNTKTVDLRWNIGFFYDRNNSLLVSLFLSDYSDEAVTLNIYPGLFRIDGFSPGFWGIYSRSRGTIIGISTIWSPRIGYSFE